jgi:hypothetical protein
MSRILIVTLIYHRHKPVESINLFESENTAVGICHADDVAPSIHRSWH